jgi:hypothetical protein
MQAGQKHLAIALRLGFYAIAAAAAKRAEIIHRRGSQSQSAYGRQLPDGKGGRGKARKPVGGL